jgi:hypothetical protein
VTLRVVRHAPSQHRDLIGPSSTLESPTLCCAHPMIRTLLFFSACLGICWLLLANASQAQDPSATAPAPLVLAQPAAGAEPRSAAVVPAGAEVRTDSETRGEHAPSAVTGQSATSHETDSETPVEVGNLAAPIPYVAKRLDLSRDDPRLALLSDWLADRRSEEHRLTERVSQLGGSEQREAMQAFNAAGDAWRRMLIQQVGYDLATRVLDTFCMYRFDPAEGSWHRVDAVGDRVPFLHEDDDIWQRGESSNPSWEGHW